MSFGDNLRRIRIERGFHDAKQFADILKIPYTTYINYEKRSSIPKENKLKEMATALSTSIDDLFGFKPQKMRSELDIVLSVMKECSVDFVHKKQLKEVEILVNGHRISIIPDADMIDIVKQAERFAMFELGILRNIVVKELIIEGIEQYSRTGSAFLVRGLEEKVDKNGKTYKRRVGKKVIRNEIDKRSDSIKDAVNKNFDDLDKMIEW